MSSSSTVRSSLKNPRGYALTKQTYSIKMSVTCKQNIRNLYVMHQKLTHVLFFHLFIYLSSIYTIYSVLLRVICWLLNSLFNFKHSSVSLSGFTVLLLIKVAADWWRARNRYFSVKSRSSTESVTQFCQFFKTLLSSWLYLFIYCHVVISELHLCFARSQLQSNPRYKAYFKVWV